MTKNTIIDITSIFIDQKHSLLNYCMILASIFKHILKKVICHDYLFLVLYLQPY